MQTTEKEPENKDEQIPEEPGTQERPEAAEQSEPQEKPDAKAEKEKKEKEKKPSHREVDLRGGAL